jgi:ATP-dependent DNA ligase
VRLYSRPGNDLTYRFPLIVETLARLRSRSCIIDGEAVACDDNGVASFDPCQKRIGRQFKGIECLTRASYADDRRSCLR